MNMTIDYFVPLHQVCLRIDGHSENRRALAREVALRWGVRRPGDRAAFDWGALPSAAARGAAFSLGTPRGTLAVLQGADSGLWLMRREVRDRRVEGRVWRHEIFVSDDSRSDIVGVRTSVAFGKNTVAPDAAPFVVASLVRNCVLRDGAVRLDTRPTIPAADETAALLELIGSRDRLLPVLVFSHAVDGDASLDVKALAQRLAGFAHVMVAGPAAVRTAVEFREAHCKEHLPAVTLFWPCTAAWSGASLVRWSGADVRAEGFFLRLGTGVLRASCGTASNWFGALADRVLE